MDRKESLKQQIDQLAAELNVAPGYAKNTSEETLEKRLAELEEQLPDGDSPDIERDPDESEEPAQDPETEPAPAPTQARAAPAPAKQQITATRTFKGQVLGQSQWVKAEETVTVTAAEAAEHIKARRAVRKL